MSVRRRGPAFVQGVVYAPSVQMSVAYDGAHELHNAAKERWSLRTTLADLLELVRARGAALGGAPGRFVIYPRFLAPALLREFHAIVKHIAQTCGHAVTIVEDSGLFVRATTPFSTHEHEDIPYGGRVGCTDYEESGHSDFYRVCADNSPDVYYSILEIETAWAAKQLRVPGDYVMARTTASSYKHKRLTNRFIPLTLFLDGDRRVINRQPLYQAFTQLMDMARDPRESVIFKNAMKIDSLLPPVYNLLNKDSDTWSKMSPLELLEFRVSYAHGYTVEEPQSVRVFADLYDKVNGYYDLADKLTPESKVYRYSRDAAARGMLDFLSMLQARQRLSTVGRAVAHPVEIYRVSTLDLARSTDYAATHKTKSKARIAAWDEECLYVLEPNDAMLAGWHPDTTLYAQILHDAKMQPLPEHLCHRS